MNPYISIITPVFNTESFLPACIDSIMSQSYKDIELILIDDGSTDSSGMICDRYAEIDGRIRVIHKENGGASSARNVGLDLASGTWVTFIDSDDTIDPDFFNLRNLEEVGLALQRWRFSTEPDTRESFEAGTYMDDAYVQFMQEQMHKDAFRMVAAKFLRREIIENNNIRFDINIRIGEDLVFMLEYYKHIHSVSINTNSYYNYYRPSNWGVAKYALSNEEFLYFIRRFYDNYKRLNIKNTQLESFIINFFYSLLSRKDSRRTLFYIATIPEYLKLNKESIISNGIISTFKYYLLRLISFFR